MAVSKAQQRSVAKYMKTNYDELKIRVPKGKKGEFQTYAESKGESLNGFVSRVIDEAVKRDSGVLPMLQAGGGNVHREAWGNFFAEIDASDEDVPDFERVSFTHEVEL